MDWSCYFNRNVRAAFGVSGVAAGPELPRSLGLATLIGVGVVVYGGILFATGGAARSDLRSLRRS